jgi:hypothetical protein
MKIVVNPSGPEMDPRIKEIIKDLMKNLQRFLEKIVIPSLVPIIVAVVAYRASITSAQTTAEATAKSTARATVSDTVTTTARQVTAAAIKQQEQLTCGGTITADAQKLNRIGRFFNVAKEGTGRYRITFGQPFVKPPVTLVAAHKATPAASVRIDKTDESNIIIVTQRASNDSPMDAQFSFMVLEAVETTNSANL